ncbi:MAG: uncharacterized protein A8A55_2280 [Amphiamblys sp. WSBS2006]|nr:MAG: uncharacterized protein A8A55_2280 [Amphiamblys sp. WSBS2006]
MKRIEKRAETPVRKILLKTALCYKYDLLLSFLNEGGLTQPQTCLVSLAAALLHTASIYVITCGGMSAKEIRTADISRTDELVVLAWMLALFSFLCLKTLLLLQIGLGLLESASKNTDTTWPLSGWTHTPWHLFLPFLYMVSAVTKKKHVLMLSVVAFLALPVVLSHQKRGADTKHGDETPSLKNIATVHLSLSPNFSYAKRKIVKRNRRLQVLAVALLSNIAFWLLFLAVLLVRKILAVDRSLSLLSSAMQTTTPFQKTGCVAGGLAALLLSHHAFETVEIATNVLMLIIDTRFNGFLVLKTIGRKLGSVALSLLLYYTCVCFAYYSTDTTKTLGRLYLPLAVAGLHLFPLLVFFAIDLPPKKQKTICL